MTQTGHPLMKALESLIREHQIISRLVAALEVYANRLKTEAAVDARDLSGFARAFAEIGDYIHHEKEEHILLPLLARHGFSWNSGVLPAVRREHRQERYLIEVLGQAGERPDAWSKEDRRHIAATATALVEFQRSHHELENTKLFPEVALRLNAETLDQLQTELEKFDEEIHHRERRATALELANDLIERYAPELPSSPP